MSTISVLNLNDFSDFDRSHYETNAVEEFTDRSMFSKFVSPLYDIVLPSNGGRTAVWTKLSNIVPTSTARTAGTSISAVTPTEEQISATVAEYTIMNSVDMFTQTAGVVDLLGAVTLRAAALCAEQHNYCAAAVLAGSSTSGQYRYGGTTTRAARTDIVATDYLTLEAVQRAYATLSAANAPRFVVNGLPCYVAIAHPHVTYELKKESSGIGTGMTQVNAPEYKAGVLGIAQGFLWVEANPVGTTTYPLYTANGGNGGTVDVYKTVFFGDESLGRAVHQVEDVALGRQIKVTTNGDGVVRVIPQPGNGGLSTDITTIVRCAYARVQEKGIYRIETASSLATNT